MNFFERLKTVASAEWRAYTEHPFTTAMADGTLTEAAFRHYLVQDYLFSSVLAGVYRPATSSKLLRLPRCWPIRAMCSTQECAAIC